MTDDSQQRVLRRRLGVRGVRAPLTLVLLGLILVVGAACGSIARPQGWAAPALTDDTLYVSLDHGKLSAARLGPPAQVLWEFPSGDGKVPLVVQNGVNLATPKDEKITFEGLYGNPVIVDDAIFLTAYSGHVIALNRTDGRARWVAELPGRVVGGVLVQEGRVYAGNTKGDLYAFDRQSGAVQWRQSAGSEIWSAPVLAAGRIVVAAMDGYVTAFAADGTRQWRVRLSAEGIAATPTVAGDRIYAGSFDRRVYALDAATGATVWRSTSADNWFWTQAIVQDNTVFIGSLGGTVYAFDAAGSGEVPPRWSQHLGAMVRSRPVLVDGLLVVGTRDGRLYGLQTADGSRAWDAGNAPASDDPTAPRGSLYADLWRDKSDVYVTTEGGRSSGTIFVLDTAAKRVHELKIK